MYSSQSSLPIPPDDSLYDHEIGEFLAYLQQEKRYSPLTIKAYHTDLRQFADYLAGCECTRFAQVQGGDVRAWLVSLIGAGLSAVTLNRKIASLKSFYRFLKKRKGLTRSPMTGVIAMRTSQRLPEFVERRGMELLLEELSFADDFPGCRDRCVLELLYSTGIRRAELIALKDKDIDWSNHHLRITGKGARERLVPMIPALENLLRQYIPVRDKAYTPNGFLIVSNTGRPAYPTLIQNIVGTYLKEITSLSRKSPHILRHTFATHLSNQGAPLNAIKELMGHSSLAATQIYTHNTIARLQEVYRQSHPKAGDEGV